MQNQVITRTPKEVYKLWIDALRSGEYKQTKKRLKDDKGFCCLGVLCDLASKDGGEHWQVSGSNNNLWYYRGRGADLPYVIKKFMQIPDAFIYKLMDLNDNGKSFKTIATFIEKNLLPNIKH